MFGWYIAMVNLSGDIWNLDRVKNIELEGVLNWLVIKAKEAEMVKLSSKGGTTDIAF